MTQKDKDYIWSLMPNWVKEVPEGLAPTFYGTLTKEGDLEVHNKIIKLLKPKEDGRLAKKSK